MATPEARPRMECALLHRAENEFFIAFISLSPTTNTVCIALQNISI
jgi:hypothetical protein